MKTKMTLLIDSDLLSIAKNKKPDIIFADELEKHLAEILGVQKAWVDIKKSKQDPVCKSQTKAVGTVKTALALYTEIGSLLDTEFTTKDFKKAMMDVGCRYTKLSWKSVPDKKLRKLMDLGKIERAGEIGKGKYRKIAFPDIGENKISNKMQEDRKILEETMH